jgi:hypothetical protein
MSIWDALRSFLQRLQGRSNSAESTTQNRKGRLVLKIGIVIVAVLVIEPEANQGYLPLLITLSYQTPERAGISRTFPVSSLPM